MRMHHVEALAREAPPQRPAVARQRTRALRQLAQLDLHAVEARQPTQRLDLVAHEPAALRMGRRGPHVRDHERTHPPRTVPVQRCGMMAAMQSPSVGPDPRTRPIAVFDSGVGGLTVLHELLVRLPREDFLYLGDTARFPYGERSRAELERFAAEIAEELLRRRAKLLVVACNSATSAAMPGLVARMRQTTLGIDVLGVVTPEALQAVAATRSGRIGLLATPTTVASGAYERAITAVDPHVTLHAVPCPTLASIIQDGQQFDERAVETVRAACEPLRAADVDTVILGCTHYPLIGHMLQRMLGPDVTLVTSGAALARQVEHALSTRNLSRMGDEATGAEGGRGHSERGTGRGEEGGGRREERGGHGGEGGGHTRDYEQGEYRFLCTGDVHAFRELGTRFLQMPMTAVEPVQLEAVEAVA